MIRRRSEKALGCNYMNDTFRGTLKSIMIVDDHEAMLYSLVEVFEVANSTVRSVVFVESTVKPLEEDIAAVERSGLSAEEMGDLLMQLIPDTDSLSRFRSRWNPKILKLRICLDTDSNGERSQDVRTIVEPSVREQLGGQKFENCKGTQNPNCAPNKDAEAHPATSNEPKDRGV